MTSEFTTSMPEMLVSDIERRILIVDDDVDFAEGLAAYLDLNGNKCAVANTVETALKLARDFAPDVALLDIKLDPVVSGVDLIPRLQEERPAISCIMVTAFAEVETAIDAVRKGAYDYLKKPLNFEELHTVLNRCFEKVSLVQNKRRIEGERDKLAAAIGQIGEGVMITDAEGEIRFVNPALERITGYSNIELIGKMPNILKSGKHSEAFYEELWSTIKDKRTIWRGRVINRKKDGSEFETDQTISPVLNKGGDIENFVSILRDISYEASLEARLHQSQKLEAIGTLAAGIAHDFNNILTPIYGYTELLLRKSPEGSKDHDILTQMHEADVRAKNLVKQILSFSRPGRNEIQDFEPHTVIKESIKFLRSTMPATIDITQDIDESAGFVRANPTEIHQVVLNIITNAGQAMSESGGSLHLSLKPIETDGALLKKLPQLTPGPHIRLTISDTGPGMTNEVADRVFEPFYTTKGIGEGTGLGLSTVYGIVKSIKGALEVETAPGEGAAFHIYFPKATPDKKKDESQESSASVGSEHILHVDDEVMVSETAKMVLERQGYTVETTLNGPEALERFRANPDKYDLVITDLTMPKMTGDVLAREMLKIRPDLPIILCSGFTRDYDPATYRQMGIRALLMKPFSLLEIGKVIREALDES